MEMETNDLREVVSISKKMIRKFVLGMFGEETLSKVDEAFKDIKFDIDKDPKVEKECVAYCRENEVFWTEKAFKRDKNTNEAISTTIHELSHAFSNTISKGRINSIIEEAIANLFAEMTINYCLQEEKTIPYISYFEYKKLMEQGYVKQESYIKEGEFLRSVLYPLKKQGKDTDAIKEYLFGSKEQFVDIATSILGEKFTQVLDNMKDVKIYLGKNDSKKYLPKAERQMISLLDEHFEQQIDDEYSDYKQEIKKGEFYSTGSPILTRAYCDKLVQQHLNNGFHDIDAEKIHQIAKMIGKQTIEGYGLYGITDFITEFISSWYQQCNGDLEKFKTIMEISNGIPFEQVVTIINDKHIDVYNDATLISLMGEYNFEIDEQAMDHYLDEYYNGNNLNKTIFSICQEIDGHYNYIGDAGFEFLSDFDFTLQEQKSIFKFFYSSNREESLKNLVKTLEDNGILGTELEEDSNLKKLGAEFLAEDIAKELPELQDLQTIIDIQNSGVQSDNVTISKLVIERLDKEAVAISVKNAIEMINLTNYNGYQNYITNQEEIIENIKRGNFRDIQLGIDGIFSIYSFAENKDSTRILFNTALQHFYKHMDKTKSFDFIMQSDCRWLINEDTQSEYGIDITGQKRLIECIKKKLNSDNEYIDCDSKKEWNELITKAEARLTRGVNGQNLNWDGEIQDAISGVTLHELNDVTLETRTNKRTTNKVERNQKEK